MSNRWESLLPRLHEIADLAAALRLLHWDQAVMMPPGGGPSRARAIATLEGMLHERMTAPEMGDALGELTGDESLDDETRAHVRVLSRDYEKATKVPPDLVKELAELEGLAYQAWTKARPASDFSILLPHLERMVQLKKEQADALGWEGERYDALLDTYEPDMKTAEVEVMFAELTNGLRPLVEEVLGSAPETPEFLTRTYDPAKQEAFSQWLVERLGFDTHGGRLDTSPHPFTAQIAPGDVRQTTKADPRDLMMSIFATIHETGHALYEQGIPERLAGLPAGHAPSLGLHESQSRMWENQVGRSRAFTEFMLPHLKEHFPEELGMITPEDFYTGANHPRRTLIRVTADELTYNLHVALRFEIEIALFRDELAVADLPDAWDAGMEKHLGIRPDGHADGVLQDMHWSIGALGYFPTYTLGNLYAAALYARARADLPDLDADLRRGDGSRLLQWMRDKIHSQAYLKPAKELGEDVLGEPLSARPFLDYVGDKFRNLYARS
ncbi:MAG TPA: carboxypeptidase M32 [Actinomycetota bacterium]|nr:carboxypeptidase M32 [Actinomycetota bacterium]